MKECVEQRGPALQPVPHNPWCKSHELGTVGTAVVRREGGSVECGPEIKHSTHEIITTPQLTISAATADAAAALQQYCTTVPGASLN